MRAVRHADVPPGRARRQHISPTRRSISPDISTARARIASARRPVVLAHRPDVIPHPTFARLPITARADVDASVAIVVPRALTPSAPGDRRVRSSSRSHERVVHRRAPATRHVRSRRRSRGRGRAPERARARIHAQGRARSQPLLARAHASDAKSSTASAHAREARHQRGTKRARACLAVFCAFLVALSMTRPLYGGIDVFETDGSARRARPCRRGARRDRNEWEGRGRGNSASSGEEGRKRGTSECASSRVER